MNNENRKIVKYDPNTGAPIYEEVPVQVEPEPTSSVPVEPVVDNSRFQPQQNNSFEQPVQQPMPNNYQQPMQNNYQQPVQQPQYQQPMMNQYQPQNNLNQTSYQPSYEKKKSNKGLIIGIILGIIVLIAIVVVGYFVFFDGKDDKKTDDTNSKPTTTINDYDDPTPTPEPEPTTSNDYISYGHLKFKKYSGYTYTKDGSALKVKYNKNGLITIYETTSTELQSNMETEEDFENYLINEVGADSVDFDDMYSFEKDTYKYIIFFIEHDGKTFMYFCSSTPDSYYYVEGVVSDPDATSINTVLDALENVLSNIEK